MEDNQNKNLSGSGLESAPSSPVHSATHASSASLSDSTSDEEIVKEVKKERKNKGNALSDSGEPQISPTASPTVTPTVKPKVKQEPKTEVKTKSLSDSNVSSTNASATFDETSESQDAQKARTQEQFSKLTEADVQINLRLLSDIKEGEKIMIVEGRWMKVDQRYVQSVRRWWTEDSRDRTLSFIEHVITSAKEHCNTAVGKVLKNEDKQDNMTKLLTLQSLLNGSLTGLGRMMTTYGEDKHNRATIETYVTMIRTFCDQDLKKAIKKDE
ncbi:hypothetical protein YASMINEVIRUS_308 [Yasminevirus sp. GU-2018]|uniref:Uncharacterized protein n=1 Tax=Yasminevirus sp. GU-2018 TaxID=2420051 RepID=A0A5K0U7T3_9VIRU|nr:hypothetical protein YASMINEVIRUS_308 [Yasminevirus sp. GU-2018]